MATRLVLLTATYPTGRGETFLADELPYLAGVFDAVTVVPERMEGDPRALPSGVTLEPGWARAAAGIVGSRRHQVVDAARTPAFWGDVVRRLPLTARRRPLHSAMVYTLRARVLAAWLATTRLLVGDLVLYSYWLGAATLGADMALRRVGARAAVATRAHRGDVFEDSYSPPYLPLRAATLRAADGIFPVSEAGLRALMVGRPWLRDRCAVHRLGVPDPGFDARPSEDGVMRVVSCAFVRPVKRLERLVDALAALALLPGAPPVRWDHFGGGAGASALEARAREALGGPIEWRLHGDVPHADVLAHYRERPVDALVNVSASEGVSVALMEAASVGVPLVATAVGGTPEIVSAATGALLPADVSPVAVADALVRLAPGTAAAAAARRAAKAAWRARYRAEVNYPPFAAALAGLEPGA